MSFRDAALFDTLRGGSAPFLGFGPLVPEDLVVSSFRVVLAEAQQRLRDVFGLQDDGGLQSVEAIESVIASMWSAGWDPEKGDLDLFARDFGTVLYAAMLASLGGTMVFRSATDLSHASVWWASLKTEAFPYHKVAKRLLRSDGEDLGYFWRSLAAIVGRTEKE